MKQLVSVMAGLALAFAFGPAAHGQAAAPTDPQIVEIVQTANRIDIEYAHIALRKATDTQVKDFAKQMVSDHTALEKSVAGLAKKLGVKPESSSTSRQLWKQARQERTKLNGLSGKAFDEAYISNEVAFHQEVIDAATKTLIPDAKNAELKSALQGAAPMLQGHLQRAQKIQQSLQSGSNGQ